MVNESNKSYDLVLIDGSSYLYRAFHALPPLTNSQGQPTGAIYGVINMIKKLLKDYPVKYFAVVFDAKGKTFRHEAYPAYKAHRPPMPTELAGQIALLQELIRAMGLPLLIIEGVEADDVIATLASKAKAQNLRTLISTGDKDMAQLVCETITLINTMNDTLLDQKGVKSKFGVSPVQIIDYLALMGDSSDNVPGVPKVGPKTAVKWLEQFQSLTNIMEHAAEIGGKIGENLKNSLEQLPLSRDLVTLKKDVELGFEPQDLKRKEPNKQSLLEILQRCEFKKWLAEMLATEGTKPQAKYHTILDKATFDSWLQRLKAAKQFAFDTETTSLNSLDAEIVGLSFAIDIGEAIYIPVAHDYLGAPEQLARNIVLEKLKPLLEDPAKIKLGQNLKYDMKVLKNYAIELQGVGYDTMLESYILNSAANRHDMDTLALKYLGIETIHFEDIAGKGQQQLTFNQIELEKAAEYAAEDADIVLRLHKRLLPDIAAQKGVEKVFTEIEMPLVSVLANIEYCGVYIDVSLLEKQSLELTTRIELLRKKTYAIAGQEFNLSSPKQLHEILYAKLGLPILKRTPKGQPSTAENVLQELALEYPLPKLILEYRSLTKLKTTYLDALPKQINKKTGRIHTSYNQAVTSTGRLSSTNPNLQNIPTRTEEGRNIRKAFVAPKGTQIVAADYSQIELRIMAHLSQDQGLITAFTNKEDIHRATASEIFSVPLDKVTQTQRREAKTINFGLLYGMSAFGLAQQLNLPRGKAQEYIERYFDRYPNVRLYIEEAKITARQQGYVETLFGRKLYVPDIKASNMQRRNAAERAAINAPMQGSAADIIKIAMINIDRWIQNISLDVKMIMQVHDELVFEIAAKDTAEAVPAITNIMTSAAELSIPMEVNVGIGTNWDEAH